MGREASGVETNVKEKLARLAIAAREKAYVPYSHFSVGAALLAENGEIFTGCNIENASYPAGLCAERVAIFKAVSEGHRKFTAIAITGGSEGEPAGDYCMPCGMCRQVMTEFCGPDFEVFIVKTESEIKEYSLGELLPFTFDSLPGSRSERPEE